MKRGRLALLIALITAEILSGFELAMIYSALRYMIDDFGNPEAVGWAITGFLLASGVSAAICGRLGDMYDRKRVLLIVIGLSLVGSLVSGFSTGIGGVVTGRVIQGGAGAIFPLCVGIVRAEVRETSVPLFIGILAATMTVSAGLGSVIGGILVDNLSWHWIFFTGAGVAVVALLFVMKFVPARASGKVEKGVNFSGGILFAPAIVLLLLAITKSAQWGWLDARILGFFAGGTILTGLWVNSELKARVPLIQVRLLAQRQMLAAVLAGALLGLTWFQFLQIWSILLQQPTATGVGLGLSATMTGIVLLPQTLMALIGGPAAGWVYTRYGPRFTMSASALVLGAAWLVAAFKHDSLALILAILIAMGLASSFLYATIPMIIASAVPMNRTSEATGLMSVIRVSAMGIGAQIVAYLLNTSTVPSPSGPGSFPDQSAYLLAMSYVIGGCLLIFVVARMLTNHSMAERHGAVPDSRRT
jgi:MFS family permease